MSYAAAIEQLNAMVPELYTRARADATEVLAGRDPELLGALGDPQRGFRRC